MLKAMLERECDHVGVAFEEANEACIIYSAARKFLTVARKVE